ncbi:hypothetical protein N9S30_00255 [bacterium]|nr:hypothetical protein [bacterium]
MSTLSAQMNLSGSAAIVIPGNHTSFITRLNSGCQDWLTTELDKKLAAEPIDREYTKQSPAEKPAATAKRLQLNQDVRDGYVQFRAVTPEADKLIVKGNFDLTTPLGLRNLFDSALRKQAIPLEFRAFYNDALEFVKQGNSRLGLANMFRSWSMTGFGMWAHISPSFGMQIHLDYCRLMQANGFPWVPRKAGGLIYKPPSGSKLDVHHDGIPTRELLANLEAHAKSETPSWMAWAQAYGMQSLAHLDGGHDGDGSTFVIATESPRHQLEAMKLIKNLEVGSAFSKDETDNKRMTKQWLDAKDGPYFIARLIAILPALNAILVPRGYPEMYVFDISPGTPGPFIATWALGVFHGSKANTTRRISLTLPSGPVCIIDAVNLERRTMALAIIASSNADIQAAIDSRIAHFPGTSPTEVRLASEIYIDNQKTPLADGLTHKSPQFAGDRVRNADGVMADRPRGPFQPIAPTIDEARAFLSAAAAPAPW